MFLVDIIVLVESRIKFSDKNEDYYLLGFFI